MSALGCITVTEDLAYALIGAAAAVLAQLGRVAGDRRARRAGRRRTRKSDVDPPAAFE